MLYRSLLTYLRNKFGLNKNTSNYIPIVRLKTRNAAENFNFKTFIKI